MIKRIKNSLQIGLIGLLIGVFFALITTWGLFIPLGFVGGFLMSFVFS